MLHARTYTLTHTPTFACHHKMAPQQRQTKRKRKTKTNIARPWTLRNLRSHCVYCCASYHVVVLQCSEPCVYWRCHRLRSLCPVQFIPSILFLIIYFCDVFFPSDLCQVHWHSYRQSTQLKTNESHSARERLIQMASHLWFRFFSLLLLLRNVIDFNPSHLALK